MAEQEPPPMEDEIKAQLSPFSHQVAGHTRLLVLNQTTLCKPLIPRELRFYLNTPDDIKDFTPTYKGVIRVKGAENNPVEQEEQTLATENQKVCFYEFEDKPVMQKTAHDQSDDSRPSKKHFLLLENIISRFRRPCVLDLKMGTRQHGDHAPADKRNSQKAKCAASTSATLGVRLCGMQVYKEDTGAYFSKDKYFGRTLSESGFRKILYQFFHNGICLRNQILDQVLEKLQELRQAVEKQESFRFYSTSLLIVYEGCIDLEELPKRKRLNSCDFDDSSMDSSSNDSANFVPPVSHDAQVDVRMIDFAHTTYEGYDGDTLVHSGPDNGFLLGLDNLTELLRELLLKHI